MASYSQTVLSICSGVGGLDLGVGLANPLARTICYVEREAFAVAVLVRAMEEGYLDDAPVWSDLGTFDCEPWRGVVDWVVGGIPCQPYSVAGKRRESGDDRDLWPRTEQIITELRPAGIFIENVGGIVRHYYDVIRPALRGLGYTVAEGLFSAAEVGASHIRERLFILAVADDHRGRFLCRSARLARRSVEIVGAGDALGDTGGGDVNQRRRSLERDLLHSAGRHESQHRFDPSSKLLVYSGGGRAIRLWDMEFRASGIRSGRETSAAPSSESGEQLAQSRSQRWRRRGDATDSRSGRQTQTEGSRRGLADTDASEPQRPDGEQQGRFAFGGASEELADSDGGGGSSEPAIQQEDRREVANGGSAGDDLGGMVDSDGKGRSRTVAPATIGSAGGIPIIPSVFPPGPDDLDGWTRVLSQMPSLAPAICRVAYGDPDWDDLLGIRTAQLRVLGNAVVPLAAANAFVALIDRISEELK